LGAAGAPLEAGWLRAPSPAGVPMAADTYDVGIVIPGTTASAPLMKPNMQVSSTDLFAAQGFHVLIGRDILSHCTLHYNGSMQLVTLAF